MPTLVGQVHDDVVTRPDAVQAVHDAIPVDDKVMRLPREVMERAS